MFTVVSWLWKPREGYYKTFNAAHVNAWARMVHRHLHVPHRLVCVTDMPDGIGDDVSIVPLGPSPAEIAHNSRPNCYRRLRAFGADAGRWLGERILSMDLDCVIVDDITPLVQRSEDFVILADLKRGTPYNGSMWMLTAGARAQVWNEFRTDAAAITGAAGIIGSDQAWIAHTLGPNEATWSINGDGLYRYGWHCIKRHNGGLPDNARVIFFNGPNDPQSKEARERSPWIAEHYG